MAETCNNRSAESEKRLESARLFAGAVLANVVVSATTLLIAHRTGFVGETNEIVFSAVLLAAFMTPVLYLLLYRPMKRYIVERDGAVEEASAVMHKQQATVRELTILSEMMGYINAEIKQERVLMSLVVRAKELLRAEYAALLLITGVSDGKALFVSSDPDHDLGKGEWLLTGPFADVLSGFSPLRIDHENPDGLAFCPDVTRNLMAVPLISNGRVHGLLVLLNKHEGNFTAEDEDTLINFAFHAYQAIWLNAEITRMANTDGLTGLNNHRVFQERLAAELNRHIRYSRKLSLMMLDIDHFKSFNDNYGHQTGDRVLKELAATMEHFVRSMDITARYGGEEFVIVLPETPVDEALMVADRLRQKIFNNGFILESGERIPLSISIGVAGFPDDARIHSELVKCADKALYHAKRTGRNRVCTYQETVLEMPGSDI